MTTLPSSPVMSSTTAITIPHFDDHEDPTITTRRLAPFERLGCRRICTYNWSTMMMTTMMNVALSPRRLPPWMTMGRSTTTTTQQMFHSSPWSLSSSPVKLLPPSRLTQPATRTTPKHSSRRSAKDGGGTMQMRMNNAAIKGDVVLAEKLLQQMIDEYNSEEESNKATARGGSHRSKTKTKKKKRPPDFVTYTKLLKAYAVQSKNCKTFAESQVYLQKAEDTFRRMKELSQPPTNWNTEPSLRAYCALLLVLANQTIDTRKGQGLFLEKRADEIHAEVISKYYKNNHGSDNGDGGGGTSEMIRDMRYYYANIMQVYAKLGIPQKVEALLEEMYKDYKAGNAENEPNEFHLAIVVNAWSRSNSADAPNRVETLLKWMREVSKNGTLSSCSPTSESYGAAISCWSRSSLPNAPQRAEALFREMIDLYNQGHDNLRPTAYSYGAVMSGFAKVGDYDKCNQLILEMKEQCTKHGNYDCKPRPRDYVTCLNALVQSNKPTAPEMAESIITQLWEEYDPSRTNKSSCNEMVVVPDVQMYTAATNCWIKSKLPHAAERAEALYRDLQRRWECGDVQNLDMDNSFLQINILNLYAMEGQLEKVAKLLKEFISWDPTKKESPANNATAGMYNALLVACKSSVPVQPQRAESLLSMMWSMFESGQIRMKPTAVSYGMVIDCWARSDDENSAQRAEAVLRQLIEKWEATTGEENRRLLHPSPQSFAACMNAYRKQENPRKVESLFQEFFDRFVDHYNSLATDYIIMFNIVLSAWAESKEYEAPERCEAILLHMRQLEKGKNLRLKVRADEFGVVMHAWARSNRPDATERAERLFQEMKDNHASMIDYVAYTSMMAVHVGKKRRSLDVKTTTRILGLFDEMVELAADGVKRVLPTAVTCNYVLGALLHCPTMPDRSVQVARIISLMEKHRISPDDSTRRILDKFLKKVPGNLN